MIVPKVAAVALLSLVLTVPLSGQRPTPVHLDRSTMIRRALDATVSLKVIRRGDSVLGSGFFVAPVGIIVTAAHVVDGATLIRISRASGSTNDVAGVYVIDRDRDFALLKVDVANAPVVRLGNSDSVTVGERVIAVGSPLGLEATVTDGLISADRMDAQHRLLQISVPVSPGSSGGPVLAEDGRVVGVVVSGIRGGGAENLNFALPINYVHEALINAATSDPVSLSDAITVTHGGAHANTVREVESRVGPSGRVNDSINFDWKALDGVSLYGEDNNHTRTIRATANYSITSNERGATVLERHVTSVWNESYKDRFVDESRVLLDQHGNAHQYFERRALTPDVFRPGSWEATFDDGHLRIAPGSRQPVVVTLTGGVLPTEFTLAALAALPDSLPKSIYIWFYSWDTSFTAVVTPVRFDFGERAEIDVPVSKWGDTCGPETSVAERRMPVIWVTQTEGAARTTFPVLASRPHLQVNPLNRRCIQLPGLPPPRGLHRTRQRQRTVNGTSPAT